MSGEQASAAVPAFSPDGTRLAYTLKPQDDEKAKPQLHLLPLDGGEPQPLTEMPLGVLDVRWLPDGSGLVFVAKLIAGHATVEATQTELARREEDPVNVHATEKRLFRFWDQWLTGDEVPHCFYFDLATNFCRDLTPNSTAWLDFMSPTGQFDIAPDGGEIVYSAIVMNEDRNEIESRIFRVSLDGGEPECLTADAPAGTFRPRYSPDGDAIVYGRTEDRYFYADRTRLYRYDRASGKHEAWCDEWEQSPAQWEFSADGILMFVAERAARTHLYELALEESVPTQLADGGSIGSPHVADDGSVYYIRQTFQHPPEVYQYAPGGPKPQRITHFTDEAMAGIAMGGRAGAPF
jgi:dipeptidyl aminopeptidase/acylaminoacyl peptidase